MLCSGHGMYGGGQCHCVEGWKGPECEVRQSECVIADCSGHGQCRDGVCICNPGWTGEHCQTRKIIAVNISRAHSGTNGFIKRPKILAFSFASLASLGLICKPYVITDVCVCCSTEMKRSGSRGTHFGAFDVIISYFTFWCICVYCVVCHAPTAAFIKYLMAYSRT